MKKIIFALSLSVLTASAFMVYAQPGRYVRKKLQPNFFIPQSAIEHKEVLPPFYYEEPEVPQKKPVVQKAEKEKPIEIESPQIEASAAEDITPPEPFDVDAAIHSEYLKYNDEELAQTPEYQQKYNDYIKDLQSIAKTGNYPENTALNNDLAMMNSNDRIIVDEHFGIKPKPEEEILPNVQKAEILEVYPGVEETPQDTPEVLPEETN